MGFKYVDQPIEKIKTGDRVQFAPGRAAEIVKTRTRRRSLAIQGQTVIRLGAEHGLALTQPEGTTVKMIWSKPKDIQPLANFRPTSAALMDAVKAYGMQVGITKPNNGRGAPVPNTSAAINALILRGLQDAADHGTIDLPAELR